MHEPSGNGRDLSKSYIPTLMVAGLVMGAFAIGSQWADLNSRMARMEDKLAWLMEWARSTPHRQPVQRPAPPLQPPRTQ